MQNQKKAYIYAVFAVIFWSTVASAFKIALKFVDVFQLIFFTSLISSVILFLTLTFQKKLNILIKLKKKEIFYSLVLGIINPFLYYTVLFEAYSILPAQEAMVLNYTWPIMLILLSIPLLKQKITTKSIISVIISFFGIIIITTKGNFLNIEFSNFKGDFLAIGSSILWAFFWILNLKDTKDEVIKLFLNFTSGTILSAITLFYYSELPNPSFNLIFPLIYIGAFEMSITFVFWLKALKFSKTTDKVGQLIFLSPVMSLIFINLILKEKITIFTLLGLLFIITGIIIQQTSINKFIKKM
jgi:drug/metabolite transporter (DMT)-like permease